jgi:hypothetical protein
MRHPASDGVNGDKLTGDWIVGEPRWGRTIGPLIKSQMLYR